MAPGYPRPPPQFRALECQHHAMQHNRMPLRGCRESGAVLACQPRRNEHDIRVARPLSQVTGTGASWYYIVPDTSPDPRRELETGVWRANALVADPKFWARARDSCARRRRDRMETCKFRVHRRVARRLRRSAPNFAKVDPLRAEHFLSYPPWSPASSIRGCSMLRRHGQFDIPLAYDRERARWPSTGIVPSIFHGSRRRDTGPGALTAPDA